MEDDERDFRKNPRRSARIRENLELEAEFLEIAEEILKEVEIEEKKKQKQKKKKRKNKKKKHKKHEKLVMEHPLKKFYKSKWVKSLRKEEESEEDEPITPPPPESPPSSPGLPIPPPPESPPGGEPGKPEPEEDFDLPIIYQWDKWRELGYGQVIMDFGTYWLNGGRDNLILEWCLHYLIRQLFYTNFINLSGKGTLLIRVRCQLNNPLNPSQETQVISLKGFYYNNAGNANQRINVQKLTKYWMEQMAEKEQLRGGYWGTICQIVITALKTNPETGESEQEGHVRNVPWSLIRNIGEHTRSDYRWINLHAWLRKYNLDIYAGGTNDPIEATRRRMWGVLDVDPAGFCGNEKGKNEIIHGYIVKSAKGENGDCFFRAVDQGLRENYSSRLLNQKQPFFKNANEWLKGRKMNLLKKKDGVKISDVPNLVDYVGCELCVYMFDEENKLQKIFVSNNGFSKKVELVLYEKHYYRYIGKYSMKDPKGKQCERCRRYFKTEHNCDYKKCQSCLQWRKSLENHECNLDNLKMANYIHSHRRKDQEKLTANVHFRKEEADLRQLMFFDLETTSKGKDPQKCYAAGWSWFSENNKTSMKYKDFYGWDSLKESIEFLEEFGSEKEQYEVYGYYNSRFDNHLFIKELLKNGHSPKKFVIHKQVNIIQFTWTTKKKVTFRFHDLWRILTTGSLRENANDFKLDIGKGEFPHDFVHENGNIYGLVKYPEEKYWNDQLPEDFEEKKKNLFNVEEECRSYLKRDVEVTSLLYLAVQKELHEALAVAPFDFFGLGDMAYKVWAATVVININKENEGVWKFEGEAPTIETQLDINIPTLKEYTWSINGMYGGMTYPVKKYFRSSHLEDILEKKIKHQQLEDDYLMNMDVVSLYPYALRWSDMPLGKSFDIHLMDKFEINEKISQVKDRNYEGIFPIGLYHIKYVAPKDLIIPLLPHREVQFNQFGEYRSLGINWDLIDSEGVYSSMFIECALSVGYKIQIIDGIYWKKKAKACARYIDQIFQKKSQADRDKNNALRTCMKGLLNSLYGKFFQALNLSKTKIVRNAKEAHIFMAKHHMVSVNAMTWTNELGKEECIGLFEGVDATAPKQLGKITPYGVFCLDASKIRMYFFRRLLMRNERFDHVRELNIDEAPWYGDTDSMHILMNKERLEILKPFSDRNELGNFVNDNKQDGKIIWAIYFGPKSYAILYLLNDNSLKWVCKDKGKPKHLIRFEHFRKALFENTTTSIPFKSFKRTGMKEFITNKKDEENRMKYSPFSVIIQDIHRNISKVWNGRLFFPRHRHYFSVPIGFDLEKISSHVV